MRHVLVCLTVCLSVTLGSCRHDPPGDPKAEPTEQGWTKNEQWKWYRGSQGSRLVPLAWLLALEEANSATLFLRPESVKRFGYLMPEASDPVQLPIGFALDKGPIGKDMATDIRWAQGQGQDVPWVGMNCSACHTAEIQSDNGRSIRIDGGPTIADFQGFENSLNAALGATAKDGAKFARFAEAVFCTTKLSRPLGFAPTRGCSVTAAQRVSLNAALDRLVERQQGIAALNSTTAHYGYARLDAVGHIFNKIAYLAGAPRQFGSPPDAPVSYPFIWNVPQHDFVQWNGIAPNRKAHFRSGEDFDLGGIVRNTSEVIGVFADVEVTNKASITGWRSSVHTDNLDAMETLLATLQSPAWPEKIWPRRKEDLELAEKVGKPLFTERCSQCHAHLDRTDTKTPIKAVMSPIWPMPGEEKHAVDTDPWMACNAFTYQALSGRLKGLKTGYAFGKDRYGDRAFTRQMLVTTTIGALIRNVPTLTKSATLAALPREIRTVEVALAPRPDQQVDAKDRERDCRINRADPLMAYKARPLNGIWATAPYLHNGSVKSLWELLLDPRKRAKHFWVGNRAYDPINVGYKDERSPGGSLFQVSDDHGNDIRGNSNLGHDYGNASFSDQQRRALVEYMKGL